MYVPVIILVYLDKVRSDTADINFQGLWTQLLQLSDINE